MLRQGIPIGTITLLLSVLRVSARRPNHFTSGCDQHGLSRHPSALRSFRAQSPPQKFPFLAAEKLRCEIVSPVRCHRSMPSRMVDLRKDVVRQRKTEPLKLQRPFGGRITQSRNANAAGKPTFDGGPDQSRRDERHRYRHVDMTNAALLSNSNVVDASRARYDLFEPSAPARDGFEERR